MLVVGSEAMEISFGVSPNSRKSVVHFRVASKTKNQKRFFSFSTSSGIGVKNSVNNENQKRFFFRLLGHSLGRFLKSGGVFLRGEKGEIRPHISPKAGGKLGEKKLV